VILLFYTLLLTDSDNKGDGNEIARALMCRFQRLNISFNIPQRMLKLRGCNTDINELKLKLEELLKDYRIPKDPLSECFVPSTLSCFEHKSPVELTDRRRRKRKIFAMNHKSDSTLLTVWHLAILPSLPAMLNKTIGRNYSATLVRVGCSDGDSRAVIQIQCQSRPSIKIQEDIRSQILQHIGEALSYYRTKVEFSAKPLVLLVGGSYTGIDDDGASSDEDDAEGGGYPHYQRYWQFPGMGASLGLACSDRVSTTLGCYVLVDNRPFILTVKHFITAAHEALITGMEPTLKVACPPRVEVDAMKVVLEQFIRDIDYEIELTWGQDLGKQEVDFRDIPSVPDNCKALLKLRDTAQEHLNQIQGNPDRLHLGEVKYQCGPPASFTEGVPPTANHAGSEHHMDWALCSVDNERKGLNRHRYHFDITSQKVDFYRNPEGIESYGAGILCSETGPVVPNARVHYVGQNTGRQRGQINGARTLICLDGRKTFEWTMVVDPDSQMAPHKYCGDSGASVIQESNNKLIGYLLASIGRGHLVIAPIEAVFQDIKETLRAENVCLPLPPRPPAGQSPPAILATRICRTEKRPFRRIPIPKVLLPSVQMPKPKSVKLNARFSAVLETLLAECLAKANNTKYKHSIPFLLTPQPEKQLKKRMTFPTAWKRPIPCDYKLRRGKGTWPMVLQESKTLSAIPVS
jgi:hypothetical protein